MRQLKITKQITRRDESTTIEAYLADVSKLNLITTEEEIELSERIQKGDDKALSDLVKANLRFVISVAKQYQDQGLGLQDLINEGNIGLIKAAQKFDPSKGFKFISYAVWWIRQCILQALAENSRIVRLPLNQIGKINKVRKLMQKKEQELEREPSAEEIANEELSVDDINSAYKLNLKAFHLDGYASDDEETRFINMMEDTETSNPDEELHKSGLAKELDIALRKILKDREREVITLLFGIGVPEKSLYEIANMYNVSNENIRVIKMKALWKLKYKSKIALEQYL